MDSLVHPAKCLDGPIEVFGTSASPLNVSFASRTRDRGMQSFEACHEVAFELPPVARPPVRQGLSNWAIAHDRPAHCFHQGRNLRECAHERDDLCHNLRLGRRSQRMWWFWRWRYRTAWMERTDLDIRCVSTYTAKAIGKSLNLPAMVGEEAWSSNLKSYKRAGPRPGSAQRRLLEVRKCILGQRSIIAKQEQAQMLNAEKQC